MLAICVHALALLCRPDRLLVAAGACPRWHAQHQCAIASGALCHDMLRMVSGQPGPDR